jgi:hypothetical protein
MQTGIGFAANDGVGAIRKIGVTMAAATISIFNG